MFINFIFVLFKHCKKIIINDSHLVLAYLWRQMKTRTSLAYPKMTRVKKAAKAEKKIDIFCHNFKKLQIEKKRRNRRIGKCLRYFEHSTIVRDKIALHLGGVALRISDVEILQSTKWINDQLISFYYTYLYTTTYKDNHEIYFVSPEVAQCIRHMQPNDLRQIMSDIGAHDKNFIFFPLTDNESTEAGGTHWSLLVFSRPEKTFFHFDSHDDMNMPSARLFMIKVKDFMHAHQFSFKSAKCLQQTNNYDCGVHVLCVTDNVANHIQRSSVVEGAPLVQKSVVNAKRSSLLKIVADLGGTIPTHTKRRARNGIPHYKT